MAQKAKNKSSNNKSKNTKTSLAETVEDVFATSEEVVDNEVQNEVPVEIETETESDADITEIVSDIQDTIEVLSDGASTSETDSFAEIDLGKRVVLKSIFFGKVTYISSTTKARYVWKDYGSIQRMTMAEIQTMHNECPEFLERPLLVTNEKDVVEYFNLGDTYRNVHVVTQLKDILASGNIELIRLRLAELANIGLRDSAIAQVRKLRDDKILTSKDVMDVVKDVLKLDLE